MKLFLAFAFRDEDKELVDCVERLLTSHYWRVLNGEGLGGEQLTPAVQARIEKCQALVGLLTRREAKQAGGYTTHQWVLDEIGYARARGISAIALVEDGIDVGGMYQPHEYIPLDRASPVAALLNLSETVGLWRRESGRTVKVQLLPSKLGRMIADANGRARCTHRLFLEGKYTPWMDVTPVPEGGGTFVYVEGVQEDHLIQIRVEGAGAAAGSWESVATSQWLQVSLARGAGK
ncbi:MAG TPA: hypothetical protein VJ011_10620 [Steroidobacteraceae bacterium]|nr:hypothetical protein [Steroidobacteraceae bacterium]